MWGKVASCAKLNLTWSKLITDPIQNVINAAVHKLFSTCDFMQCFQQFYSDKRVSGGNTRRKEIDGCSVVTLGTCSANAAADGKSLHSVFGHSIPAGKATTVYVEGRRKDESEKSSDFEEGDFKAGGRYESSSVTSEMKGVAEGVKCL